MLQNLWLEVKGFGKRGTAVSKMNPAVALSKEMHDKVYIEQSQLRLFDRSKLSRMSYVEIIEANETAMRNAGVPELLPIT